MVRSTRRLIFFVCGLLSLVTGIVGIFLPLLPTTPLVILAAWCFSKSSERFLYWLHRHQVFGPLIRDWEERGAIPLGAKALSTSMISLSIAWIWFSVKFFWVKVFVTLFLLAVVAYIVTRPNS
jgi:uncharacterized protein